MVTLRYSERVNIDAAAGLSQSYVFSANGIYDPNITGTGHQPLGFDQWMLFYNHYTVSDSRISVQFTNINGATSLEDKMVGVQLKASSTVDTNDVNTIIEQGSTKMSLLHRTTDGGSAKINYSFNARSFFGVPTITDDIYRGTTSANPAEQAYYHLLVESTDTSTNPNEIIALVVIEYRALLTEPRPLPGS
jgi:hypothetical protein